MAYRCLLVEMRWENMKSKEAKAWIKFNKLLEDTGWRFFNDENGPATCFEEASKNFLGAKSPSTVPTVRIRLGIAILKKGKKIARRLRRTFTSVKNQRVLLECSRFCDMIFLDYYRRWSWWLLNMISSFTYWLIEKLRMYSSLKKPASVQILLPVWNETSISPWKALNAFALLWIAEWMIF